MKRYIFRDGTVRVDDRMRIGSADKPTNHPLKSAPLVIPTAVRAQFTQLYTQAEEGVHNGTPN